MISAARCLRRIATGAVGLVIGRPPGESLVFPLRRSLSQRRKTATPHHAAFTVGCRGSTGSAASAKLATYETTRERMTKMAGNAQEIIALDRQRMTAMAKKDIATLNKIIADDLIYTHSSARTDTKKTLIGAMDSGATVYTSVEPSDVVAQDFGDVVVLTGVAAISVNSGGTPNSFRVRFIDVYARRGGQWQMVTWQSTKLA
jgi:ketosteroid isomerase-like protein